MPVGLINVGDTFQREMDAAFRGLINHSVVVYLDDVTVFSINRSDHILHLRKVLERCRNFGNSLNPKKTIFAVTNEILLGFVVSKEGIMIDLERTKAISRIPFPSTNKSMQSFMGKINFVRRFVPSFSEIVRSLQNMIKKDNSFSWGDKENESFIRIREAIAEAPALVSPDFKKYFILYTFAADISYAVVLTQKNQ